MPDDLFTIPRLAALYDTVCMERDDTAFYAKLAGVTPLRVLDLGCGTGQLTSALIERGHAVTGVDPAGAMLEIARDRPGGDRATWNEGDARTVRLGTTFDLIVLTGHAFQVFLTDEDVQAVLRTARAHRAPGGRLAFETRNPLARAWEQWTPEATGRVVQVEGAGEVELFCRVVEVSGAYVGFEWHHRFRDDGATLLSHSRLRFMPRDELARHLASAGFTDVTWLGDWDGAPFDEQSPEIIVIAR